MTSRTRNLLIGGSAALVVVVVLAVVVGRHSGTRSTSAASPTTSHPHAGSSNPVAGPASDDPAATTSSVAPAAKDGTTTTTLQAMPLHVAATSGVNLHDGQAMTVTVTADPGSDFYGMEGRLCAGGASIATFYDFTPDPAGNCVLHAVSSDSDAYVESATPPPYSHGTMTFRVGVGTSTFTTEDLQTVSITCGPGHPCQLVVRLQYPHGYGFRYFPVTYAG